MNWKISLAVAALCWFGGFAGMGLPEALGDSAIRCPAGVEGTCKPRPVGTMTLCTDGDVMGYRGISHYCLTCHADTHPMSIKHPYEVKYPEDEGFRDRESLHEDIELNGGYLTCKSCHAGSDPASHYLVERFDLPSFCNHCHTAGIKCPGDTNEANSDCYPGRVYGKVRCFLGDEITSFENTSTFCVGCHGGQERLNSTHPLEIDYPHHRGGFTDPNNLNPNIKLEGGKITCESCHFKSKGSMDICNECHPK
jgi:hypothetical protein